MDQYNFFVTASIDNSVLVWDIRTQAPSHSYSSHFNRKDTCGVSISPCLKFLAVASEDRSVHLLDLRMMADHDQSIPVISRLVGHGDVVSDVSFNPLYPQLATACHDGRIRFFADPNAKTNNFF